MKKIILLTITLITGLWSFGDEEPFAPYKDTEKGYSFTEAKNIIGHDSILAIDYCVLFQQIAEKDGWIKKILDEKITLENAVFFISELKDSLASWNAGEVVISEKISDKNGKVTATKRFTRPSYSDRIKKTPGLEPVGVLDITSITGWKDVNGNPYPRRIVMAKRCLNSIFDSRDNILPISPLVTIVSNDKKRPDSTFRIIHDTVWMEPEDAPKNNRYMEDYTYVRGRYYYVVPTYYVPLWTFSCRPTYWYWGYHSCPVSIFSHHCEHQHNHCGIVIKHHDKTTYYGSRKTVRGHGDGEPVVGGRRTTVGGVPLKSKGRPGGAYNRTTTQLNNNGTGNERNHTASKQNQRSEPVVKNGCTYRVANTERSPLNNQSSTRTEYADNKTERYSRSAERNVQTRVGNVERVQRYSKPTRSGNNNSYTSPTRFNRAYQVPARSSNGGSTSGSVRSGGAHRQR